MNNKIDTNKLDLSNCSINVHTDKNDIFISVCTYKFLGICLPSPLVEGRQI